MDIDQHEKLRTSRSVAGYKSAAAAAQAFGWNVSTYRHHENGTRGFGQDHAKAYGRAFNVSPAWLLGLEENREPNSFDKIAALVNEPDEISGEWKELQDALYQATGNVLVHHFQAHQFSVLYTSLPLFHDENQDHWLRPFSKALLEKLANVAPNLICSIDAPDDSMSPTIKKGDLLLLDTGAQDVADPDAIWLISIDGNVMITRMFRLPNGRVSLWVDSQANRSTEMDFVEIRVKGRIVWIGQSV
ncbi:XRE family transcriptional regulator [Sphingobium yanoikuyae]|uniref:XRE family transcriptional regulator n=1 Tax=Sphingobium yanoikuyae TaxID=13690 RepID=UPI000262C875|nr:XRE family transcriptional regulator [Sphingobium yanoikuyae]